MSMRSLLCAAASALALLPALAAAAPVGLVTIVDGGDLFLLRGTQRLAATEGVRLEADDIVRSGQATRLVRLELGDGTTLDLGPDTELLLRPQALPGPRAALLYLQRGWLKIGAADATGIATPQGDLARVAGSAVLRVNARAMLVFAESGRVELARDSLREGDAWVRRDGGAGGVQKRPPADLLEGLPRGFADPLPRRSARFESLRVAPGPGEDVAYADVAAWLNGEAPLRAVFVPRFAARAHDPAFRSALVAELRAHPEWDRTLFPEKYRPKPVAVARRAEPVASQPVAVAPLAIDLHGLMSWPGVERSNARPADEE